MTGTLRLSPIRGCVTLALALTLGLMIAPLAQAQTCGGEGERACCLFEAPFGACESGVKEVPGCAGDCLCTTGFTATSTCIEATPCGGAGQRACCVGEGAACGAGLEEIPGCSGDCYCGPAVLFGELLSTSTCGQLDDGTGAFVQMAEPTVGCTNCDPAVATATDFCSPRGVADLHAHLFADLGHGGAAFVGKAYDPAGGVNAALAPDYGSTRDLVSAFDGGPALPPVDDGAAPDCPPYLSDVGACAGQRLWHGDHTTFDDPTGTGSNDTPSSPLGAPVFNGWPTYTSAVHQQMYWKWLERAWRGGLRVMVMLAVHSEAFCEISVQESGVDCADSMGAIDRQIDEAWAFQGWLDGQHGGPNQGWFRIARTPNEARLAIQQGKLAVLLGIEVDNLFNCRADVPGEPPSACPDMPGHPDLDTVQKAIDHYYDRGVRHVFPVHNFDNKFAGTATWLDPLAAGNRFVERLWPATQDCATAAFGEPDYGHRYSQITIDALYSIACIFSNEVSGRCQSDAPPAYANETSCNAQGLTPAGIDLVERLAAKGMLIDVDHMSNESFQDTLDATAVGGGGAGYPLVASHGLFFDLHAEIYGPDTAPGGGIGKEGRHERQRTRAQLDAIAARQGMVAVMAMDDVQQAARAGEKHTVAYDATTSPGLPGTTIPDDCRHSTKSFAQAYAYAVDVLGPSGVAIGTDFNGVAAHLGPRFGSSGCGGEEGVVDLLASRKEERSAQERLSTRVPYPFTSEWGTFDRQVTGQKTFDFNRDGLAHVGLLPDLLRDLDAIGFSASELDPLMTSANAYLEVWERARGETCPVPEPSAFGVGMLGVVALASRRARRSSDRAARLGAGDAARASSPRPFASRRPVRAIRSGRACRCGR